VDAHLVAALDGRPVVGRLGGLVDQFGDGVETTPCATLCDVSRDLQPCAGDQGAGVYSRAAQTYDRVGPSPFTQCARRIVELLSIEPNARILDVATGTGAMLVAAAKLAGPSTTLVGIDVSEGMLQRARETTEAAGLSNVSLRVMDAQALEFANEWFDYVLCGFALGSIPDPARALSEMRRVLRPAGRLGLVHAPGWFFQHDPRWLWQEDLFRQAGVSVTPYDSERAVAELTAALCRTHFANTVLLEESCPLVFNDEAEWWTWLWSHGSRRLVEQVPRDQLPTLQHALTSGLARCREGDGLIHGRLRTMLALASKPVVGPTRLLMDQRDGDRA
jgi:ubiquinone/menaquinone biosynthesis C-methylase UbiE